MSLSTPFIRRPVMTTLVMAGILAFGSAAYRLLPVSDLPNVDFPTIQVSAALPGASPETMASSVATPLERQFTTIAGLASMSSTSTLGATQITLQFDLSRNLDAAAQDVQSSISAASRQLPPNLPTPPTYQKVNPADMPILYLALTSQTLPLSQIDEYGETLMAQRISSVPGVAQVQVFGSQKYAVRIQLDPQQLVSRGLGIDEVASAVEAANVNLPTGTLYGPTKAVTVQATGQLTEAAQYAPLVVAWRNGSPVRLSDVGRAQDSVENDKTAAWYATHHGTSRSIVLAIQRQPGTNTVEVAGAVKRLLPQMETQLPRSVNVAVLFDRSLPIEASVHDVKLTLVLTLLLVVGVIFLFLRNVRATVIPSLALPMSIVGTFAVMWLLGFSLDNLSLMALTLSVGFVVDDAIVMLENVVRHVELGEPPREAALKGAREIGFTIVSMTISLSAVFIPVLFMGGIVGRLFHEFAVTIGVAILVSGFVSLSLTPMLCARLLRERSERPPGRFYRVTERGFDAMLAAYGRGLRWSLDHRRAVVAVTALALVAMIPLFAAVPKGFLPSEDTGQIFAFTEAAQGVSWEAMAQHQLALTEIGIQDPAVEGLMSSAGARGASGSNTGVMFMRLGPRGQRPSVDRIIERLRPKLMQVPGIRAYLQNPPPIRIGGQLTKSQYQVTLQDPDTAELYKAAPQLEARMRKLAGLRDVTSDLQLTSPQVTLDIDRDRAASYGVSPQTIEDALYTAYGSRQVSTIYTPVNEYQVIVELEPRYQADPAALRLLQVRAPSGQLVPLESLARLVPGVGPLSVSHSGQLPAVTISFNLDPGASLGTAVSEVNAAAHEILPPTVTTRFQGIADAFQSSLSGLGWLLLLAVLVIYLVLGILYESYIHPITILTALPFAGFGALLTLLLFRTELSIYAFVGVIMLVGLVKKNGIMMIDFAIGERARGRGAREAIEDACRIRFRPIMMTTLAALMGTLPIALGFGAGSESRRPLGLSVVGGLLFSQLLTLFVTPVFYVYMEELSEWLARIRHRRLHVVGEGEPGAAPGEPRPARAR
ncbi:efflux RND transporter permease subunit [Anaeromyxobacter oryzae]|uniref:Multidrug transporter n=1 Tax=Anaeromyxobacter oryzae TaxID=2918170 RepID=A0ABM7WP70_9BACT|nr:efflux RND transporter permease subunit [Anaeromyxobacter oryzae]BDG01262.1 multidrug transporter [Anaeromyxobacter oryzae]